MDVESFGFEGFVYSHGNYSPKGRSESYGSVVRWDGWVALFVHWFQERATKDCWDVIQSADRTPELLKGVCESVGRELEEFNAVFVRPRGLFWVWMRGLSGGDGA